MPFHPQVPLALLRWFNFWKVAAKGHEDHEEDEGLPGTGHRNVATHWSC